MDGDGLMRSCVYVNAFVAVYDVIAFVVVSVDAVVVGTDMDDVGKGGGAGEGVNMVCSQLSRWTRFFFSRGHRCASAVRVSVKTRQSGLMLCMQHEPLFSDELYT